jgi:hypothetical protein
MRYKQFHFDRKPLVFSKSANDRGRASGVPKSARANRRRKRERELEQRYASPAAPKGIEC